MAVLYEFVTVCQSDDQESSGYGILGHMIAGIGSTDFIGDRFLNCRYYPVLAEESRKQENLNRAALINDNSIDDWDLLAFCGQWLTRYN